MNFSAPYQIIGQVDEQLVDNVCREIQKINDDYFNYIDHNSKTGNMSWLRLDFAPDAVRNDYEQPLFDAGLALVKHVVEKFNLDNLSSFSVSMLKPNEILEEHTDSRFIHRITNRYLVPLIDDGSSYNYWIVNGQQVRHFLKRGQVIRLNNAIIHSAVNGSNEERYNLLIDTFNARLKEKFSKSIDLAAPLSTEGLKFSVARKAFNKNDKKINELRGNDDTSFKI